MKIYIETDMEGISDFVNWEEADFTKGRGIGYTKEFLTEEVNAAIKGIYSVESRIYITSGLMENA